MNDVVVDKLLIVIKIYMFMMMGGTDLYAW